MTDKEETAALKKLGDALVEIEESSRRATDGKWLERLTADYAPLIAEWDVREAWTWEEWPGKNHPDSGIDVVAERGDGELIAIQCKSRELDDQGSGAPINKGEIDSFIAESSSIGTSFAERWLVVNGAVNVNDNAQRVMAGNKVAHINLYADIKKQHDGARSAHLEGCPHCQPDADAAAKQTRDCMQREAVQVSVCHPEKPCAKRHGSGQRANHPAVRHRQVAHSAPVNRGANRAGTGLRYPLPFNRPGCAVAP